MIERLFQERERTWASDVRDIAFCALIAVGVNAKAIAEVEDEPFLSQLPDPTLLLDGAANRVGEATEDVWPKTREVLDSIFRII